ncbi:MAG: efflux RND transporter periplasmic adaptor subunit [Alphaproteobacteria bacterium]|nr:efflux RND transporter periplasmic adaptor subunit [Alphaproteobacteria bacterium]
MMTRQKRSLIILIITAAILLCLAAGAYWFVNRNAQPMGGLKPSDYLAVEAEKVRRGSIVKRITVIGTLIAEQKVVIRPEIEGKITKILFKGGSTVEAGAPLIEIDPRMFEAQVKEAEARFELAKAENARHSKLAAKSAGPVKILEKSVADLKGAEAQLDVARIKLANTIIRAPFAGVVGLKDVSIGMFVDPRTEVLTLVDVDPIVLDFRLPASYLKVISVGQQVNVLVDGFENKVFKATISAIDAKVDPSAHSLAVRASIPNERGLLKPGLFARVKIVVGAKDDAMLLPESSVLSRGEEEFVYRIVEVPFEGVVAPRAMKTFVTTGLSESGSIEIVKGVKEGDLVITVGQTKIRPGYPVRVVEDIESAAKDEDEDDEGEPVDEQTANLVEKTPPSKVENEAEVTEKVEAEKEEVTSEVEASQEESKPSEESAGESTDQNEVAEAQEENRVPEVPAEQKEAVPNVKEETPASEESAAPSVEVATPTSQLSNPK